MLILAGLGNPGDKYRNNRHNIGFMAADAIARRWRFGPERAKFQSVVSEGLIETPQGDMIGIRQFMFLSLSYDHRVVDGSLGGSFVRRVADYLEKWDINRPI